VLNCNEMVATQDKSDPLNETDAIPKQQIKKAKNKKKNIKFVCILPARQSGANRLISRTHAFSFC
jgi:2-phospho-L-lactate guanylyltransferase (CobY/MobA/RfbA family)